MGHGEYRPGMKIVGSRMDLEQRALLQMIRDKTGRGVSKMMDDMLVREGVAAGFLNPDGTLKPEHEFALRGNMALLRDLDEKRKRKGSK